MKILLKYTILALFILNLPGFLLNTSGAGLGSLLSYASFGLLSVYYIHYLRGKPNLWLIYAGLSYFLIAGLDAYEAIPIKKYVILIIKYLILVVFGNSFFKSVTKKEMVNFLLFGAITIIINAAFFPDKYGRYSGFYLNPNAAGFICLIGFSLCFSIKNKKYQNLFQLIFTIAGLLTFSRTFIIVWILINLVSIRIDIKNIRILGIGVAIAVLVLTFGALFNLNGLRFKQYQAVFTNEKSVSSLEEGGRSGTWALFYDEALKHPVFGGGFGKFQGRGIFKIGPHNTYLLILGEAGIISLLIFVALIMYLLFWANRLFKRDPTLFLISMTVAIYLMVSHTFYGEYIKLCVVLFVYNQIELLKRENTTTESELIAYNKSSPT